MGIIKKRDTHLVKIDNMKINTYFQKKGFDNKFISNNINKILLECINENNSDKLKLFIEYAFNNNIKINLNEKFENGDYLIFIACRSCIEMVQLLMDYANKNNIILELNEKNKKK